ncbi:uncharacterized protein LOC118488108 isoform X2 [Helianthus annuus]|uniref:uncharacterized protein LOC118488108 isoform X2 n=1 Tax=Helianthus annuus TaxID=4232 RepID=UPI0016532238|nr:uncharacterized protein LOC118488108 isoform X2 [Helianthus annuus]
MRERSRRKKERRRSSTAVSGGGSGVRRRLHLGPVVLDSDRRSLSRSDEYSVSGQVWVFGSATVWVRLGSRKVRSTPGHKQPKLVKGEAVRFGQRFGSSGLVRFNFGMVDSVKPSQLGQPGQLSESTRSTQLTRSTQSTFLALQH